VIERKTC